MRPPILFLIIDCLRADKAKAQSELAPTGFLGRLVRRGYSFTNAVTVTPTTTPAVTTMLTGLYPFEHGLRGLLGFTLRDGITTIASTLGEVGYRTEADVTGPLLPQLGLFHEFDDYRYVDWREATLHTGRGDELAERIRALGADGAPWFLVFHVWDLHEPRRVPRHFRGRALSRTVYDRALAALDDRLSQLLPEEALDGVVVALVGDHGENLRLEPRRKLGKGLTALLWLDHTRWLMKPLVQRYIRYAAHSRSRRALRLAPRAFITHGHHLFEPLLRVPYVFAGPGVPSGSSDALVSHTDLAPTIAALADSWFAGGVESAPLRFDGAGDKNRRVILETAWATPLQGVRQVGLRTPRWKYMEVAAGGGTPALFDLVHDPGERRNVAGRLPEVVSALRGELQAALAGSQAAGGMSDEDAAVVERRLRELGYL